MHDNISCNVSSLKSTSKKWCIYLLGIFLTQKRSFFCLNILWLERLEEALLLVSTGAEMGCAQGQSKVGRQEKQGSLSEWAVSSSILHFGKQ